MTIQIDWDNPEKTIVRYDFSERWTWEEFYAMKKAAFELINTV